VRALRLCHRRSNTTCSISAAARKPARPIPLRGNGKPAARPTLDGKPFGHVSTIPVEDFACGRLERKRPCVFETGDDQSRSVPCPYCFAERPATLRFVLVTPCPRESGIVTIPRDRSPAAWEVLTPREHEPRRTGLGRSLKVRKPLPHGVSLCGQNPHVVSPCGNVRASFTVRKSPHNCSLPESARVVQIENGLFCDVKSTRGVT